MQKFTSLCLALLATLAIASENLLWSDETPEKKEPSTTKNKKIKPTFPKKKKPYKKQYWWKKDPRVWNTIKKFKSLAPYFEISPQAKTPEWVKKLPPKPLFSFIQIADLHLWRCNTRPLEEVRDFAKRNLHPNFSLFTGDNVSGPDREKNQKHLKKFLDTLWSFPYHIVRGDNDAVYFEENFGSTNWAFLYGGVQFVGFGLDIDLDWVGIGTFERMDWLKKRLSRPYPTVVVTHEPIYPPNFLNALEINHLVAQRKNVILVVSGHLHYDFEARYKHTLHIIGPSPTMRHLGGAFKEFLVYSNQIVVKTYEKIQGRYQFAHKWQRVKIPSAFRPSGPHKVQGYTSIPHSQITHLDGFKELFEKILEIRLKGLQRKLKGLMPR